MDFILILLIQIVSMSFFYMLIHVRYEKKHSHKTVGEVEREISSRVLSIVVYLGIYNIIFFLWWYFP
jgi:hypothetical protein